MVDEHDRLTAYAGKSLIDFLDRLYQWFGSFPKCWPGNCYCRRTCRHFIPDEDRTGPVVTGYACGECFGISGGRHTAACLQAHRDARAVLHG